MGYYSKGGLINWEKYDSTYAPQTTYAPTDSRTNVYSPQTSFAPATSITYPNIGMNFNSPFASNDLTNRITQEPRIIQEQKNPISTDLSPNVSPSVDASKSSGIDPTLLIIGAVVVLAVVVLK